MRESEFINTLPVKTKQVLQSVGVIRPTAEGLEFVKEDLNTMQANVALIMLEGVKAVKILDREGDKLSDTGLVAGVFSPYKLVLSLQKPLPKNLDEFRQAAAHGRKFQVQNLRKNFCRAYGGGHLSVQDELELCHALSDSYWHITEVS